MKIATRTDLQEVIGGIVAPQEQITWRRPAPTSTLLTKPLGSLGRLEDLAAQWFAIRHGSADCVR